MMFTTEPNVETSGIRCQSMLSLEPRSLRFVARFLLAVLLFAVPLSVRGDSLEGVRTALRGRLESLVVSTTPAGATPAAGRILGESILAREALPRFYEQRGFLPAWLVERPPEAPTTLAGETRTRLNDLVTVLRSLDREGLEGEKYHRQPLERLVRLGALRRLTPSEQADLDLLATDAFLMLAAHRLGGRVSPETFEPEWRAVRRELDLLALLDRALDTHQVAAVLEELHPTHPAYRRLLEALAIYRAQPDWSPVGEGPTLRLGDRDPRVLELRRRLELTGDAMTEQAPQDGMQDAMQEGMQDDMAAPSELERSEPEVSELFDTALETAVRRFQRRHGLDEDGVAGKQTLAALAVPRSRRVLQIELNLERWRWLPRELGERHVLVNLPAYRLVMVEGEEVVLESRAVVGREARSSPVLSDKISYLVLNPAWEVPMRLAVEDKLPEIRRDVAYLEREGFRVLSGWGSEEKEIDPTSVDWASLGRRNFPYRLRQQPGARNALGRIKFMFPNPYDVYIHDTPGRELFQRSERAASSGCIRIEHPVELASLLLKDDPSWTREAIQRAIDSGKTRTVTLPSPVPVHLQHWTAWVEDDGTVSFRADLYGRDARLAQALEHARRGPVAE